MPHTLSGMDAFGTILERAIDDIDTAFIEIGDVTNFSGPSAAREAYDSTHHRSPQRRRQFIPGLVDEGEISMDVNYRPDVHDILVSDFDLREPRHYRMVIPDFDDELLRSTYTFAAFITAYDREFPVDNKATATITFKITGPIELSQLVS